MIGPWATSSGVRACATVLEPIATEGVIVVPA
jgi:hypothetical protein